VTPADPVVETAAGRVRGRTGSLGVAFCGIPYAAPVDGPARFRAPPPPVPWTGVRDAHEFGPAAPQRAIPWLAGLLPGLGGRPQSEDCLSLNVWAPDLDPTARRPVMVWLHGGGFTIGAGSEPWYDGARLARRGDVVVVTMNYRLGLFGSLHAPAVLGPEWDGDANCGLRDQLAALDWVAEHIRGFGGDPGNVTLFGESAGAMAVGALLGCPAARGRFHRAIAQSGAAHNVASPDDGADMAERLLRRLELTAATAHRLTELPLEQLLVAQMAVELERWSDPGGRHLPFAPVVDGDLFTGPPLPAIAAGAAAGVDLLVGTNADEWNLFQFLDPDIGGLDEQGFERRCRALEPGAGAELAAAYRDARPGADPWRRWLALRTDWAFAVPAARLAAAQAPHARTWTYRFTWASPAFDGGLGACHALELPFVFDTHHVGATANFTGSGPDVAALTAAIQDAWTAFAHTGSPVPRPREGNGDGDGPLAGWSPVGPDGAGTAMALGATCGPEPARPPDAVDAFWRAHR
jgi:para-nitrobenzyl esterase